MREREWVEMSRRYFLIVNICLVDDELLMMHHTLRSKVKMSEWIFFFSTLPLNLVKEKRDMSRMARRMSNQQVKWLFCLTLVNLVLFRESTDNESDGEKTWREERWCCGRRKILSGEKEGRKCWIYLNYSFSPPQVFAFFLSCKIFSVKKVDAGFNFSFLLTVKWVWIIVRIEWMK